MLRRPASGKNAHSSAASRLVRVLIVGALLILVSSACTASAPTTDLARLQAVETKCNGTHQLVEVATDESDTSRGATSSPERQSVIRDELTRTAVCGGTFQVRVFAGSAVGQVVITRSLSTSGATETARLRKAPKLVDQVIVDINGALPAARDALPGGATDIVGQYQPAAEFFAQASASDPKATRSLTILTDGIQTAMPSLADQNLSANDATKVANTVTVDHVRAADVRVLGIGRVDGTEQLPTGYVEALKAFHQTVCERSGARSCFVATDPTTQGGGR